MNMVLLDKRDGYAIVTLNRPEAMNALSRQLREDFVAAFADCVADENVRVVTATAPLRPQLRSLLQRTLLPRSHLRALGRWFRRRLDRCAP